MSKRPDPMETMKISLEILRIIPKGGAITSSEIRDFLEDIGLYRDIRTIQRLLEVLSETYDIERDDSSKPYRYKWKEKSKGFSLPSLTNQECLLLTLAEQQLGRLLPSKLLKSMEIFFSYARSQLENNNSPRPENEWLSKVCVVPTSQPLLPPVIKPEVLDIVSTALFNNSWLNLDYKNASGWLTSCRVMPLGLAQQGERMYLVCRYEGYEDERNLALHRIISASESMEKFIRPNDFDLNDYISTGHFGYGNGHLIKLSFNIDKATGYHILESRLSEDQEVTELEQEYVISATVVDSDMLDWWLRGFGDAVSHIRKTAIKS